MTNFAQRTAPSTTTRDPWPHPPSLSLSSGPFSRSTSPCRRSRWKTPRFCLNALKLKRWKQWGAWRSPVKTRTPTLTAETWWTTTGCGSRYLEQNFDNNQQTFLPFISTHPPPPQASLPCWRPCCQSLQLKRSYSTQKSKISPLSNESCYKFQALRYMAELFSEMMYNGKLQYGTISYESSFFEF